MPNRTEGPTNAAEFEVGSWLARVEPGPARRQLGPLVLEAGRFVKSWRRLTATHDRMKA
jgi:hypothetical protein